MKKLIFKISQREKIYLIAGGLALFIGLVAFPGLKAASAFRQEQLEALRDETALLEDLNALVDDARVIQQENEMLRDALKGADELLFPPIENHIMMQTQLIKLLNEMGPDLGLEVSAGRSSVGDASTQMNMEVKGRGRYPEILKFLHRMETYRPLILVDSMSMSAPKPKKSNSSKSKKTVTEKTKDPSMGFKISIQIHTRAGEEGGA
ncbi:GspMb/PilO family protein [Pontiella sulfatireligans]|uniref:Uncharacterized protein n=1 Tax=Pontiella sulfatireligans TaxID=2750658 RepID=A0A6C2UQG1_9BACT|nr:GspMb/PilO family protein [Pontiella sulfatireligans]VGO22183.1 hypothetical protein SCARR_04265 [Pontiella sulfatireligans]